MKTKFSTNSEICHFWANNNEQQTGSASNIFFEGPVIYSYGHHFALAAKVYNKTGKIDHILLNNNTYSNSTAKHKNHIARAVSHYKNIYCNTDIDFFNPLDEVRSEFINIKNLFTDSRRANKHKVGPLLQIKDILNKIDFLVTYYRIKSKLKTSEKRFLTESLNKYNLLIGPAKDHELIIEKRESEKREQRRIKQERENMNALQDWKNFNRANLPYYSNNAYLRINTAKNRIETSLGVKVDFNEAKRLINLIENKNIIGSKVNDQFTVTAFNGIFKAGCHSIPADEINNTIKQFKDITID